MYLIIEIFLLVLFLWFVHCDLRCSAYFSGATCNAGQLATFLCNSVAAENAVCSASFGYPCGICSCGVSSVAFGVCVYSLYGKNTLWKPRKKKKEADILRLCSSFFVTLLWCSMVLKCGSHICTPWIAYACFPALFCTSLSATNVSVFWTWGTRISTFLSHIEIGLLCRCCTNLSHDGLNV